MYMFIPFYYLVCYTYPRKRDPNTFEVDLLYMLNLIIYNLIIDLVHVLITNVSFVPDDCGHCSINKYISFKFGGFRFISQSPVLSTENIFFLSEIILSSCHLTRISIEKVNVT